MKKAISFPGKYIQGVGVLAETGHYASILGKRPLLLWGKRTRDAVGKTLLAGMAKAGLKHVEVEFCGECTKAEARRAAAIGRKHRADVVLGIGGGKVIDAGKGVADLLSSRFMSVPTIASNDSPTSACTIWYNDKGEWVDVGMWPFNPDIVLADTAVIARAPVRYFVAGMGDALSTYPEACANYQSQSVCAAGGVQTMTAMAIARLCFDTLMQYGVKARKAVAQGRVTPEVERVVEANVLLSGVGWESGGLACAHAIANALPDFPETHGCLHGEKVSFGLMSQMCLDRKMKRDDVTRIVEFMIAIGLPVTLKDIGLAGVSTDRLMNFARRCTLKDSFVHHHPFKVTAKDIFTAMLAADELGRKMKG